MSFFLRYLRYVRPHAWRVAAGVAASLLFVAFSGVGLWLAADFLQALFSGSLTVPALPENPWAPGAIAETLKHYSAQLVLAEDRLQTLRNAILFIVGAFFIKNLSLYVQTLLSASIEQRVAKAMRDDLYANLLRQDLGFFHQRKSGDLVAAAVNDIATLNAGLADSFGKLLRDPFSALLFLLLLLAISWKMTLAALLIAPLSALLVALAGESLKRKARRTQERVGKVVARLNEALYGMRIVQAYGGQEYEKEAFQRATDEHFRQALGRERMRRAIPPIEEMVGIFVIAGILLVAGGRVLSGAWLEPGDFVRFLVLLFGLLQPFVSLGEVGANLRVAEGAAGRVFELMDARDEVREAPGALPVSGFTRELRLEHVTLRYQPDRPPALKDVSLAIHPGEQVVLVGRSGSGKSSLLNLLPRFYDPSEGRILLDGRDLRELRIAELRRLFGIVTQEVVLFHDTVAANIAYACPDCPRERIVEAAKKAQAHEFIQALPGGYDTSLGDLGGRLSGGQRQRISIARALLSDPPILLLDEPTSALDSDVAEEIQRTLDEVGTGRTVITATHRLASITRADRVFLFEKGELLAEGTHETLLAESRLYREVWEMQVGE